MGGGTIQREGVKTILKREEGQNILGGWGRGAQNLPPDTPYLPQYFTIFSSRLARLPSKVLLTKKEKRKKKIKAFFGSKH